MEKQVFEKWVWFIPVLVLLTLVSSVPAEIITVRVDGVVEAFGGLFPFDDSIEVGSPMIGYCVYDTETPDLDDSSDHGSYALESLTMTIGNYTLAHDDSFPDPSLFNTWANDLVFVTYSAYSTDGTVSAGGEPQDCEDIDINLLYLYDAAHTYPEALPVSFPPIQFFFFNKSFGVTCSDSTTPFEISGEITDIGVVPEPATLMLFGLGAMLVRRKA